MSLHSKFALLRSLSLTKPSLTRRMLAVQLLACAVVFVALEVVTNFILMPIARDAFDQQLNNYAQSLLEVSDPASMAAPLTHAMGRQISSDMEIPAGSSALRYEVRDAQQRLLAASPLLPQSGIDGLQVRRARDPQSGREVVVAGDDSWVKLFWQIQSRRQTRLLAIGTALLIVPPIFLLTFLLARFSLSPLRDLSNLIGSRSADNLDAIVAHPAYPETAPLLHELNRLLEKLRAVQAIERQFFADAAHGLLTPIAVIQTQAHLLATAADESDKQTAKEDLHGGLERVSAMIRQLLTISRVSSQGLKLQRRTLDLAAWLEDRVGQLAPRALDKRIDIGLETRGPCLWAFDPDTLASAIDNLLDNAIRYVPSGGRIRVTLRAYRTALWLIIADDGPGIPDSHMARIFERFYRVPDSEQPGSGLGLAIAQQIVRLHGGELSLGHGLDKRGLAVRIRLEQPL